MLKLRTAAYQFPHSRDASVLIFSIKVGADLGLLAGGSQSVVVICRSTYDTGRGGGRGEPTRVVLLTEGLILAVCKYFSLFIDTD